MRESARWPGRDDNLGPFGTPMVEITPEWWDKNSSFKAYPRRKPKRRLRDRFADALAWLSQVFGGQ